MVLGGVLHYGEAEAGAAGLARVALVHAVEALEDALLRLAGYPDAVVADGDGDAALRRARDVYARAAAALRVFYGVVGEVPDYLPEQLADAVDALGRAAHRERDAARGGLVLERGGRVAGEGEHIRVLARELLALVEAGEVYDVLHELHEPRGLAPYAAEEAVAVLGLHEPVLQ